MKTPVQHHNHSTHHNPCRAAGVLFYTFKKGKLKLLLQSSDKGWVDLGGKTENKDGDIFTTAAREASEECNCALVTKTAITNREDLLQFIPACTQLIKKKITKKDCIQIYIRQSKYLLFITHLTSFEARNLKQSKLLDRELFDGTVASLPADATTSNHRCMRTVGWKSFNSYKELLAQNAIHPRLRHKSLYNAIEPLQCHWAQCQGNKEQKLLKSFPNTTFQPSNCYLFLIHNNF